MSDQGPLGDYGRCIRAELTKTLARQSAETIMPDSILSACASEREKAVERGTAALRANPDFLRTSPDFERLAAVEQSRQVGLLVDSAATSEIRGIVRSRIEQERVSRERTERIKQLGDTRIYCTGHPSNWSVRLDPADSVKRSGGFLTEEISQLTIDGKLVEIRTSFAQRPYRDEKRGGQLVRQYYTAKPGGIKHLAENLQVFKEKGAIEYRIVEPGENYHYWYFIVTSPHFRGPDQDDWFLARLKRPESSYDCMDVEA